MNSRFIQFLGYASLWFSTLLVVAFLLLMLIDIFTKGAGMLSLSFLTQFPSKGMTEGGILPILIGTVCVTLVTVLAAVPIGLAAAVYLNEYAEDNTLTRLIRSAIRNLAGVPSVIYGLFGVVVFVDGLAMGTSILASGLTLGLLTLPTIVSASEEALKNVPYAYREASLALGSTRWECIWHQVLPTAKRGILTGVILAISRAAGETAPILFTGVTFYQRFLPSSLLDEFMAMPYHIYILSTQHHAIDTVRPIAYGTALLLLLLILGLNLISIALRKGNTSRI